MIPSGLRNYLKKEFDKLFINYDFSKCPTVYEQDLPTSKYENQTAILWPWVLIKIPQGEFTGQGEGQKCSLKIYIGVNNDDENSPEVLTIIEILNEFLISKKDYLNFDLKFPVKWSEEQDEVNPYTYGLIELDVIISGIIPEEGEDL